MTKQSSIQWTDFSWNPWQGCQKVSEGCKFCYMMRDMNRYGRTTNVRRSSPATFRKPLTIKQPAKVFTCSWSDFFIKEADEWRPEAWEIIKNTPHITYQILTKRPERIKECLPFDWWDTGGYPNVWLGVTVESDKRAAERIPLLLDIPCKLRFLSVEPLIEAVDLSPYLSKTTENEGIGWVIVGGESGNDTGEWRYRPCNIRWFQQVVTDCQRFAVPFFVKQLGTNLAKLYQFKDRTGGDVNEWIAHSGTWFGLPIHKLQNFPAP
jgi:protein gp37